MLCSTTCKYWSIITSDIKIIEWVKFWYVEFTIQNIFLVHKWILLYYCLSISSISNECRSVELMDLLFDCRNDFVWLKFLVCCRRNKYSKRFVTSFLWMRSNNWATERPLVWLAWLIAQGSMSPTTTVWCMRQQYFLQKGKSSFFDLLWNCQMDVSGLMAVLPGYFCPISLQHTVFN